MRPILNVVGISKMMELADYNYRPPPGGPPGGGWGGHMRWPYVSRAGLRQNHEWLVGGLELGVAVTRSG